jgi:hypothetical protein
MEKEDSLRGFNKLRFSRLEDTGDARVLRFPMGEINVNSIAGAVMYS